MKDKDHQIDDLLEDIDRLRNRNGELEAAEADRIAAVEALRDSEMRFRSVAQSAVDGIILTDDQDNVIFWNQGAVDIFGYKEEDLLGQSVTLVIPDRYKGAHREGLKRYLRSRVPHFIGRTVEVEGLRKNGEEFPLELSLSSWTSKEGTFFSAVIRDITFRRESLKALQQRTAEARQRTEELESLIQTVAHDLKSPVITIAGLARLLKNRAGSMGADSKTDQVLEQLVSSAKSMELFLKDLLDGLTIPYLEPQWITFQLDDTIRDVVRQHKHAFDENEIKVATVIRSGVPAVAGDEHRVRRVLDNLVLNAIRHMGRKSKGKIRIEVTQEEDYVVTRVSDNGVGIPREYQSRIFDRFFRLPGSPGSGSGSGLGLHIAKGIIESHRGRIWVESETGEGATFCFTLPTSAPRDATSKQD